ncbi:MAG: flagellar assembly protein FliX [Rubrivivax sp.]
MRIENNTRVGGLAGRSSTAPTSSSATFEVASHEQTAEARPATAAIATTPLDALLALQAVEDPLLKRKKLARRGSQLIDTLEGLRTDLLAGRLSEGRLNQLMALMSQAREQSDPELDSLLDDIELRARVELAKRGLYPG